MTMKELLGLQIVYHLIITDLTGRMTPKTVKMENKLFLIIQ